MGICFKIRKGTKIVLSHQVGNFELGKHVTRQQSEKLLVRLQILKILASVTLTAFGPGLFAPTALGPGALPC